MLGKADEPTWQHHASLQKGGSVFITYTSKSEKEPASSREEIAYRTKFVNCCIFFLGFLEICVACITRYLPPGYRSYEVWGNTISTENRHCVHDLQDVLGSWWSCELGRITWRELKVWRDLWSPSLSFGVVGAKEFYWSQVGTTATPSSAADALQYSNLCLGNTGLKVGHMGTEYWI